MGASFGAKTSSMTMELSLVLFWVTLAHGGLFWSQDELHDREAQLDALLGHFRTHLGLICCRLGFVWVPMGHLLEPRRAP